MEHKFGLEDDHPLVRELASLRAAVKHYEVSHTQYTSPASLPLHAIKAVMISKLLKVPAFSCSARLLKSLEPARRRDLFPSITGTSRES